MTSNAGRVRFPIDGSLFLQDSTVGSQSSTTASQNQLNLERMTGWWNSAGDIAINQEFMVVIDVSAVDVDTSQTYIFTGRVSAAANMSSPQIVETIPTIGATGIFYMPISREMLKGTSVTDPKYFDINMTVGGSGTKEITYTAYVAPFPQSGGNV